MHCREIKHKIAKMSGFREIRDIIASRNTGRPINQREKHCTPARIANGLKLSIPGVPSPATEKSLEKAVKWKKKLEDFNTVMEKNPNVPKNALTSLNSAKSSYEIQIRSIRKVLEGKIKEEEMEVRVYETEVAIGQFILAVDNKNQ